MSGGAWKDNGIIEKFIVEISRIINCLTSQNWKYKVSISMVQIYFSSLTDLFRKFLEPIPELRIKTESICPDGQSDLEELTTVENASRVPITDYIMANNMKGIMKIINAGLDARKMRDIV